MELTVVVLYCGALAYYAVTIGHNNAYEAGLLKYCGSSHDLPPPKLSFKIEGRHCQGSTDEQDLMDDLYFAVQRKLQQEDNTGFITDTGKPHTTN
jgi:hypothetical protein